MATIEHCLYCFETLAAKLDSRPSLSLEEVYNSWAEYVKETGFVVPPETDEDDLSSHDEDPEIEAKSEVGGPRNPTIARLLSPPSSSSTSGSSTPSSTSASTTSTLHSSFTSLPSSTSSSTSLGSHPVPPPTSTSTSTPPLDPSSSHPLFVTWNTASARHPNDLQLRGCIGTFTPEPLSSGLSSYALISSLHDTRFPPITPSELPTLSCTVTLLTSFEPCTHPLDWVVGTHGIRISFIAPAKGSLAGLGLGGRGEKKFGACYLPDVAGEQGWDEEETVVSAMRKAGWGGRRYAWREVGELRVVRFQGRKRAVSFRLFRGWREWVKGTGRWRGEGRSVGSDVDVEMDSGEEEEDD